MPYDALGNQKFWIPDEDDDVKKCKRSCLLQPKIKCQSCNKEIDEFNIYKCPEFGFVCDSCCKIHMAGGWQNKKDK